MANKNRKNEILDAVQECVRVYGVRRFTLNDVARAAGVSRRTLYDHFADKDALMKSFLKRLVRAVGLACNRLMSRAGQLELDDALGRAFYLCMQFTLSRPVMRNETVRREFLDFVLEHQKTLNDQGTSWIARILRIYFRSDRSAARIAGEYAFRLLASYVLIPGDRIHRRRLSRTIAVSVLAIVEHGPTPA